MTNLAAMTTASPLAAVTEINNTARGSNASSASSFCSMLFNTVTALAPSINVSTVTAADQSRDQRNQGIDAPPKDTSGMPNGENQAADPELEKVFQQFVGQTFFGLMLKEMRKSIHKTPYFHGGMAEEIFEQHLDMTLSDKLAEASGDQFSRPMYELFCLQNQRR